MPSIDVKILGTSAGRVVTRAGITVYRYSDTVSAPLVVALTALGHGESMVPKRTTQYYCAIGSCLQVSAHFSIVFATPVLISSTLEVEVFMISQALKSYSTGFSWSTFLKSFAWKRNLFRVQNDQVRAAASPLITRHSLQTSQSKILNDSFFNGRVMAQRYLTPLTLFSTFDHLKPFLPCDTEMHHCRCTS